jgi:hypothetical protein
MKLRLVKLVSLLNARAEPTRTDNTLLLVGTVEAFVEGGERKETR